MIKYFDWKDYCNDIYMTPIDDFGKVRESEIDRRKRHNDAFCKKQREARLKREQQLLTM